MEEATLKQSVPDHVGPEHVFEFDIYEDAQIKRDLHAAYARLQREAPPVFYTPANGGHWLVTRMDIMAEIVRDYEHFSTRMLQIPAIEGAPLLLPLNVDPPEHTLYRQVLAPFFGPRSISAIEADVTAFAKEIVASVAGRGECDFVSDVAAPFPVTVFMRMMGFPTERLHDFRQLAERYFNAQGMGAAEVGAVSQQIVGEMSALIESRQKTKDTDPQEDLIHHLINAKINGEPVPQDKLLSMCFLLFLGGLDTVTNAMSFSIRNLATRPEIQKRLIADPSVLPAFLEESLRQYGVVNTPRLVVKDCERFGVKFRKGDMLLCPLPIAGWDDSKNPEPEKFDLDRAKRNLLTFSTGPHLCLGHFLARMEMRLLFKEWVEQIGEFSLAKGFEPSYRAGMVMSLESLPLVWKAKTQH